MTRRDPGLFGPGSTAWRLHSEPALLIGGLRALMLQALHPLAVAAVRDHSDYRSDVWGRFQRTSDYVTTTIFGDTGAARAVGARVRAVHRTVRGVDTVTGLPYSADDPLLLLWIHATLVDSFLASYERFVRPLGPGEADAYVGEMVRQAELVGLRADEVPATRVANADFIGSCQPMLQLTRTAEEAMDTFLHPPLPAVRRPGWWISTSAALSILPHHALALYGRPRRRLLGAALAPAVRVAAAQAKRFGNPPELIREAWGNPGGSPRTPPPKGLGEPERFPQETPSG